MPFGILFRFLSTRRSLSFSPIVNFISILAQRIANSMDTEINETESRICGIIADMEKGKENVAAREKLLADCEEEIKQLITSLDDLSYRLTS